MTNKRIYEYQELTELTPNHWFSIDRPIASTGKITYRNMGLQLLSNVDKIDNWKLTKVNASTFNINSQFYDETGYAFDLLNGQELIIPAMPLEIYWQETPNPTLICNGLEKPVYNGVAYERWGLTALDRNTFWGKGMSFIYDSTLDAFLLYKHCRHSYDFLWDNNDAVAGAYKLNGSTIPTANYPILTTLYPTGVITNIADTTFVGGEYDGNIIDGSIADSNLGISIWGKALTVGITRMVDGYSGDISKSSEGTNYRFYYPDTMVIHPTGSITEGKYTFSSPTSFTSSLNDYTITSNRTLTKRYGLRCHRIL